MEKKKKNIFSAIRKAGAVGGAVIRAAVTVARVIEQIVDGIKEIFTGHRGDGNGDDADNDNCGNQRGGSPLVGGKLGLLLAAAAGFGAGWLCSGVSDGVTMAFAIVAGVAGKGNHVTGEPLTTDLAGQASPGLLRNEIDDRIVKIRPMSTPLDQISRYGGSRLCGSMKVDYYSVDTRPMQSQLTAAFTTEQQLVALCKAAFTNSAGSSRKVLIGGTGLIEQLHNIDHTRVITSERAVTKWGLDFTEIHSKFGTLYVLLSEVFDQCGMPDAGMVIDPEYITKYSHVPFRTERLDLRSAGVRNTDAIVITEASCLVLRFPNSHMRIVKK